MKILLADLSVVGKVDHLGKSAIRTLQALHADVKFQVCSATFAGKHVRALGRTLCRGDGLAGGRLTGWRH
jgi:hypothetical protein